MAVGANDRLGVSFLGAPRLPSLDNIECGYVVLFMALTTRRIDLPKRKHDIGCCPGPTGCPRLVIDVFVAGTMTVGTTDVLTCVRNGDFFHGEVQVADVTSAVVGTLRLVQVLKNAW